MKSHRPIPHTMETRSCGGRLSEHRPVVAGHRFELINSGDSARVAAPADCAGVLRLVPREAAPSRTGEHCAPESAHPLSAARPRMGYAEMKRVSKLADPLKRRGRRAGRAKGDARSSSGSSTCRIPWLHAVLTDHPPHRGEKSLAQRRSSQGRAHHQRKRRVPRRSSPLPRLTRRLVIAIRMR